MIKGIDYISRDYDEYTMWDEIGDMKNMKNTKNELYMKNEIYEWTTTYKGATIGARLDLDDHHQTEH